MRKKKAVNIDSFLDLNTVENLYKDGKTVVEIAGIFDISPSSLHKRIKDCQWYNRGHKKHNKKGYLVGRKIDKLLILEACRFDKTNGMIYKCLCDCGRRCERYARILLQNNCLKTCGKCHKNRGGYEGLSSKQFNGLKAGAKKRCFSFEISIEYAWNLFLKQNKKCALSGLPIKFSRKFKKWHKYTTASLDRIDSSKGYVDGNVQWVHKKINRMKWNFKEKYFINYCHYISDYQRIKNSEFEPFTYCG